MLESSESYYRQQQDLTALALGAARNHWDEIDQSDITGSWDHLYLLLFRILSILQYRAAVSSVDYIGNALTEQDVEAPPDGRVAPEAFSGITSNGRSLQGLLDQPRIRTLTEMKAGMGITEALGVGRSNLERIATTQIQDAGRVASGVEIVQRSKVTGYIRMLNPPSCSRCIILAGKRYRWNSGFLRHPNCDCRHVPITEESGVPLNVGVEAIHPERYFNSLPTTPTYSRPGEFGWSKPRRIDQAGIFGEDGARAINDGASISQVVNARQGMDVAGTYNTKVTTQGTSRHGLAGQRLRATYGRNIPARLMPEAIYQLAGEDRALALELLYQHGYVL